jgi:hypothetical protein
LATIKHGLAIATALGNDRIIGGPATAGMILSTRKMVPRRAAKLRIGAASDTTGVVARVGLPTATHRTMDDDDEDVDVATAIERGLARRTALGNDRIVGDRVGANGRPNRAAGVPWGISGTTKNATTKKRLLSPMASMGGGLIIKGCRCGWRCVTNFRGKPDRAEALPIFCWPKNASTEKRLLVPMASGGKATTLWASDENSKGSVAPLAGGDNTARTKDMSLKVMSKPRLTALAGGFAMAVAIDNPG